MAVAAVIDGVAIEDEVAFVERYSTLLVSAWRDEAAMNSILADPKRAAIDAGLPVEAGATVRLDLTQPDMFYSLDEVARDWTATPGLHVLHLPPQPMVDVSELTDVEVDSVASWCIVFIFV